MAAKGALTVREAGRRGGSTTKKRYGGDFYKAIGKKGGETTKARMGPGFYEKIGRKGGRQMKKLVALAMKLKKAGG